MKLLELWQKIGDSVEGINVGDDVLVYPWIGCGSCPTCEKGDTNLCEAPQSLGVFQDGGYAEYSLIPDYKFLAKISGIDLEGAASLACSGLTAYTAVKKAISNSPEKYFDSWGWRTWINGSSNHKST